MRLAPLPSYGVYAIAMAVACGRIDFEPFDPCPPGEAVVAGACRPAIAGDPDLVAYWPLDEPLGSTTFRDVSPNGDDGTCTSCPTAGVPGIRHTAVQFDNARISVGTPSSITSLSATLTLLGWARFASYSEYGYILSNDRDCDGCGAFKGFSLWASIYENQPAFELCDNTENASHAVAPSKLSLNDWHFVAGTLSDGVATLYVDGQPAKSETGVAFATPPSFGTQIGAMGFNPKLGIDGAIDEVMIFRRALTADEIADLYAYYISL
jgi:hypothetical protein